MTSNIVDYKFITIFSSKCFIISILLEIPLVQENWTLATNFNSLGIISLQPEEAFDISTVKFIQYLINKF